MIIDATLGALVVQSPLNFSGSGDVVVVPGLVGKLTKVIQLILVVGGPTTLTFKCDSGVISGPMPMLSNGSMVIDYIQVPITCYNPGESFIINNSGGVSIGGIIWYIRI